MKPKAGAYDLMQIWVVWAGLRKAQPRGSIKERLGYTQHMLPPALILLVSLRGCQHATQPDFVMPQMSASHYTIVTTRNCPSWVF